MQNVLLVLQFSSSTGFKMKSLVLLVATVALATATFYGGKYIDIKEDGTVFIKTEDGRQVYITKNYGPYGHKLEVEVTGPNYFTKSYQFNYNTRLASWNKNYQDHYDILDVIFREYLGHVDEYTYQQLLNKVHKAVLEGFFDSRVFYVLQALAEETKWDKLVSGYNFYGKFDDSLNTMTEQYKYGLGNLFKGQEVYGKYYNQYDVHYFYNVLMKIFDRQVLQSFIAKYQMYNQEWSGQYSYEKMWDMIFAHEGIFDHHYLVEIINNEELRNYFIQHGFFDVTVLNQIREAYKTEGIYNQYWFQHLFNIEVLKNFFVAHHLSVYDILKQTPYHQYYGQTYYNRGFYGYNMYPKMSYKPSYGFYGNYPEYWKNMQMYGGNFWKNMMYGKSYYGYNQGPYTYGKYYHQYPLVQQVY